MKSHPPAVLLLGLEGLEAWQVDHLEEPFSFIYLIPLFHKNIASQFVIVTAMTPGSPDHVVTSGQTEGQGVPHILLITIS